MTAGLQSLHCAAFGVSFRLTADSNSILAAMFACAPLGAEVCMPASQVHRQFSLLISKETGGFRLNIDDEAVAEHPDQQSALQQLTRDLIVYVANCAPDRVFVHAGVVGWKGHALVLPGTSFTGKTTLVAELVRAGATYYSDEYAVLDEDGRVHPYARDLQMRQPGNPEQTAVAVERLNGTVGSSSLPVSCVAFAEYRESGCWNPKPVSSGMAVLEMLQHSIPVQRTPAPSWPRWPG